jgi:hypothetical protein
MNINELYEILQDSVLDNINGEFILHKNSIVWSYTLENIEEESSSNYDEENDDFFFSFETICPEEKLIDVYNDDIEIIRLTLFEYNQEDEWEFSDYKIKGDSISFKIL